MGKAEKTAMAAIVAVCIASCSWRDEPAKAHVQAGLNSPVYHYAIDKYAGEDGTKVTIWTKESGAICLYNATVVIYQGEYCPACGKYTPAE